jgi:GNAT superfamily N-acetyltransferase
MKSRIQHLIPEDFMSHYSKDDWGDCVWLMEKSGKAFARAYWFKDVRKTIYLDSLSVIEESQNQGYGTKMQEIRESIGKELGAKYSCLWVRKGTWMIEWYKKRGYKYYKKYKEENAFWMRKKL